MKHLNCNNLFAQPILNHSITLLIKKSLLILYTIIILYFFYRNFGQAKFKMNKLKIIIPLNDNFKKYDILWPFCEKIWPLILKAGPKHYVLDLPNRIFYIVWPAEEMT